MKFWDITIALIIYSIPAFILSIINGTVLTFKQNLTDELKFIRVIIIPILLLIGFLINSQGPVGYIAIFGLIPIIITNVIWLRKFA